MSETRNRPSGAGGFTGRHMLAIMVAFFGTIITVNVTMAVLANTSWTGFVVKNSYVASQEFNSKAEAGRRQAALGWSPHLSIENGRLRFTLADAEGQSVAVTSGEAVFRRPVSDREDMTVALGLVDGGLEARVDPADGVWIVEILAEAGLDKPFRETRRMTVRGGTAK